MSEDLREHIEELNRMVEAGRATPVVSGYVLAWWGGSVAALALMSVAALRFGRSDVISIIWPVGIALAWITGRQLGKNLNASPVQVASTSANRATRLVWFVVGIMSTLLIVGESFGLISLGGRAYFPVFILCGMALMTTSIVASEPLLLMSAIGWFMAGIVSLFVAPSSEVTYGMTALAASVFLVVPGLVMAKRN